MLLVLRYWPLPASALASAVLWAAIRSVARPVHARRTGLEALAAGYLAALLYMVLFLPVVARPEATSVWASVNLVPARTIVGIFLRHRGMVGWQLVGNVLLFVPLGLLLPQLDTRFRRFTRAATAGLCVSAGIELVQLAMLLAHISPRSVDVDDVMLNVAGACLGYLIWRGAQAAHGLRREDPATQEAGA